VSLKQYDAALALWRADAYAGLPGATIDLERRALDELRWATVEEQAELRLELGEDAALVEGLAELAARDPLRERARVAARHGAAAVRTARGGAPRTPGCLRSAARRVRPRPRPELLALERELVAGPPSVPVQRQPRGPASGAPAAGAAVLPLPLSTFVGRAQLLDLVAADVAAHRLVTLTARAGGAGKSRLALEHLRGVPTDDRVWVPLVAVSDAALVPAAVAEALGAVSEPGRPPLARAVEALVDRRHLLVIDNAEHVREPVARLVGELLSACPGVRVLVTSREPLGLPGERLLEVPPLAVLVAESGDGPAVQLFLDRAAQAGGWTPAEDDLEAVRQICTDLDGLPLALELAAARCRALAPQEIADALSDRFALLDARGPIEAPHHRTLEAAVQWSYDLLGPQEQRQLRALATFEGGFDLAAAQALTEAGPRATADLATRSLITLDRSCRPWRYAVLETVRAFAISRTEDAERARLTSRHLLWVAQLVADAAPHLRGPEAATWLPRLERERANIRRALSAALATSEAETALRLCGDLSWAWFRAARAAEGAAVLDAALRAAPPDSPSRGRALVGRALLRYLLGDAAGALTSAREGSALAEANDDECLLAEAEAVTAWMSALVGDFADARERARSSLANAERLGLPAVEAEALMVLGQLARFGPDPEAAAGLLLRSMEIGESCGHQWVVDSSAWVAAKVALAAGEPAVAARRAGRMVERLGRFGDLPALLAGAFVLAGAVAALGRGEEAARLSGAIDALGTRIGYSVARMDPLDAGWIIALVEQALPAEQLRQHRREGAQWSVGELLSACAEMSDRVGADLP
jgi:predicted ATPase